MKNIVMLNGDKVMVKISQDLDHHITKDLKNTIDKLIDDGCARNIFFDFTNTGFMDSSGIGLIMGRYKKLMPYGGEIVITGINPAIERIIRISGIHKIIRMELE